MNKIVWAVFLSAWLCLATGCIDHSTLISLERDGSGQIVQTTYMSAMAASMMAGMGGEGVDSLVDEQQARAKTATFGKGVRFVSVSPVSKPDGSKGGRAVYAFDDINSLQISMDQMDEDSVMGMSMESEEEEGAMFFVFDYTPGNLVIKRPAMDEEDDVAMEMERAGDDQATMAEEMGKQMMEGLLPMLKGMRIQIAVEVPDAIRKTNASHIQSDSENGVDRQIVLMDFDLDKLLDHPEGMDYLLKMQDDAHFKKMAEQLGNAGIRVEAEETVTVEF